MYRVSLGNSLCLVAVPYRPQIVVLPRTHPVYRGLNLCEQMSPKARLGGRSRSRRPTCLVLARSSNDRRRPEILAGREQRANVPARPRQKSRPNADLAERIQSILASRGLTLYQTSQRSEALYGRSSPYFVPHNLYYDLRSGTFSPSIYQFVAFSRITGYRLSDWLRVFGADLENIARLQVSLPSSRTILLDSSLTDPYA